MVVGIAESTTGLLAREIIKELALSEIVGDTENRIIEYRTDFTLDVDCRHRGAAVLRSINMSERRSINVSDELDRSDAHIVTETIAQNIPKDEGSSTVEGEEEGQRVHRLHRLSRDHW